RFRPLDAEIAPATESVPETGYGLAWSAATDYVFYVRMDEAQRPFQLWRHQLGHDPAGDVLVFEEPDRRGEPRVVLPRREGVEYAVDHLTPAPGGPGWFVVLTNDGAQDFRVLA